MPEEHVTQSVRDAATILLQCSPSPMLLFSPDLTLLYANEAHCRMSGRAAGEIIGKQLFDAFPPNPDDDGDNAQDVIQSAVARMIDTGEPTDEVEHRHDIQAADGTYEERHWSMIHWPIVDNGNVVAILQRSQDITALIRTRRLVHLERGAAERSAGISFFSYDPETDIFERSPLVDRMFGFNEGEAGDLAAPFFDRIHEDDLPAVHAEVQGSMAQGPGSNAAFDYRVLIPNSSESRFIRVRAGVERDVDDGKVKLFGAFVDMSDVERSRSQAQELADRNADLVVESNHRIKNSLAIASAMLAQQLRASEDEHVQEALRIAATRISAIADVHGELFKDAGIERVDAGALVQQFAHSFARTVSEDSERCRIDVQADPISLPSQYAVTIALTLNELLTNAVKYGMSDERGCQISIALSRSGKIATLFVANDIASREFARIASQGVGTRLVTAFARQLSAEIETRQSDKRFEVRFSFPIPSPEERRREVDPETGE